jgi:hypothetical protein
MKHRRVNFRTRNLQMIRSALAAAAIVALAASPASAERGDCAANYREFWDLMQRYGSAKPPTEDLVATQRQGLRAFDACQAGDEASFANFWENMRRFGSAQDDSRRFWTEMQRYGSARK